MSIYDFELITIDGWNKSMEDFKGKVVLLVNTASKCGYTPQYEGLQHLYEEFKEKDFVVLGFPSNDFLRQEPGSDEEIKTFCSTNFNITFPMFSKIHVKGKNIHPLYEYLTSGGGKKEFLGKVKWNFTKFLIDRNGEIIGRFEPKEEPETFRSAIVEAVR
ncbi:glutathione peroxidase [Mesotoga sp. H07pep.5.4]|uniref:glutathione peroxidase n=1 Tax=Mesotoga sp. H07pep.5.4 TaxID=1463664 RepID=UPI000EF148ED|nr:glutathione peroxidase [Mesotoga sp. H07pep.5.4]RLL85717.1 glutathione peroxidase [Mesotoga sp. H07pep.5.4]